MTSFKLPQTTTRPTAVSPGKNASGCSWRDQRKSDSRWLRPGGRRSRPLHRRHGAAPHRHRCAPSLQYPKRQASQLGNPLHKLAKGEINGQTQNALPSRLCPGKNPSESAYPGFRSAPLVRLISGTIGVPLTPPPSSEPIAPTSTIGGMLSTFPSRARARPLSLCKRWRDLAAAAAQPTESMLPA